MKVAAQSKSHMKLKGQESLLEHSLAFVGVAGRFIPKHALSKEALGVFSAYDWSPRAIVINVPRLCKTFHVLDILPIAKM